MKYSQRFVAAPAGLLAFFPSVFLSAFPSFPGFPSPSGSVLAAAAPSGLAGEGTVGWRSTFRVFFTTAWYALPSESNA